MANEGITQLEWNFIKEIRTARRIGLDMYTNMTAQLSPDQIRHVLNQLPPEFSQYFQYWQRQAKTGII